MIQRRSLAHYKTLRSMNSSNLMLKHNLLHHPEDHPLNIQYIWTVKTHESKPLRRLIKEAVLIKESFRMEEENKESKYISLNAKAEFARNVLPGVTRKASEEDKMKED